MQVNGRSKNYPSRETESNRRPKDHSYTHYSPPLYQLSYHGLDIQQVSRDAFKQHNQLVALQFFVNI